MNLFKKKKAVPAEPATPVARRDPRKQLVDPELLRLSYEFARYSGRSPQEWLKIWEAEPIPKPPLGVVRFELLRASMTVLLPLFVLGVAYLYDLNLTHLAYAAPAAVLVGYLNHRLYMRERFKQCRIAHQADRFRYPVVCTLARRLGMAPHEISFDMIIKMVNDYAKHREAIDETFKTKERRQQEAREAYRAEMAEQRRHFLQSAKARRASRPQYGADTLAAGAALMAHTVHDELLHNDPFELNPVYEHSVNYNGAPMISGSGVDINNQGFGTPDIGSSGGGGSGGFGGGFNNM